MAHGVHSKFHRNPFRGFGVTGKGVEFGHSHCFGNWLLQQLRTSRDEITKHARRTAISRDRLTQHNPRFALASSGNQSLSLWLTCVTNCPMNNSTDTTLAARCYEYTRTDALLLSASAAAMTAAAISIINKSQDASTN